MSATIKPARLAVFLDPTGPLRDAILARKALLESRLPNQAYTAHPPHCTLLYGDYGPPERAVAALRTALAGLPVLVQRSTGWLEFPDDTLAGGGHTIAYRLEATDRLLALQLRIAEALGPWHDRNVAAAHPLAGREPFATSLTRYGFPFVGSHWLPHCTIGSPRVAAGTPLLAELMAGSPEHAFEVANISVWLVQGEKHIRQAVIPFDQRYT
jgi:hypothetical protein